MCAPNYELRTDFLTHPDSVQVRYRPVVRHYSAGGRGEKVDNSKLPPLPAPQELRDAREGKPAPGHARWWAEQDRRCKLGWTAPDGRWINPVYYWYLNFVTLVIRDDKTGREWDEAPRYSDSDHEVFDWIYWMMLIAPGKRPLDGIITKGRRKHWTFVTHCGFFLYYFCQGSIGDIAIGYDVEATRERGQKLFKQAYEKLHPFWKWDDLMNERAGDYTAADVEKVYNDNTGKWEKIYHPRNSIYFREMDNTPDAFRGLNLGLVLFDEVGKYKRLSKCITATKDCLGIGTAKTGTMLVGGTSDAIDNKSKDYKKQWEFAGKVRSWSRHFIPAWKMAPPHFDWFAGLSLRGPSEQSYLDRRKELLEGGNTEGYYKEIQENPLSAEECFNAGTRSAYPATKIYNQLIRIRIEGAGKILKGRLEWDYTVGGERLDSVHFVEDPEGHWEIHASAIDGTLAARFPGTHVLGIDDVYKEEQSQWTDSECAIVVYRRLILKEDVDSDLFVARYEYRPTRTAFAVEVEKATRFFAGRLMIENNDPFLIAKLKDAGFADEFIWINRQIGIRNSPETISQQEVLAESWFDRDAHERCWHESILAGFQLWRSQNTDTGSAAHLCLAGVAALAGSAAREETEVTRPVPPQLQGRPGLREQSVLGKAGHLSPRPAGRRGGPRRASHRRAR